MCLRVAWFILALIVLGPARAQDDHKIKVGLLKFGTVAWEVDTIRHHGLDRRHDIAVVPTEFASNEAAKVALQAGAVDMIVTDWPWVARQRGEGVAFSFVPYSRAVGALMILPGSSIESLRDLKGKRIGVVGGPLDKSWLLLRAYAQKELGVDFAEAVEPVFGAPPLLNEELARGRIDAVLTYWHYAARLEASGARPLLTVTEILRRLGIGGDVPMLGYAFREEWAGREEAALQGFVAASREAKALLASSEEEWVRLAPQLGTTDPAVLAALQEGFRVGIPERWSEAERKAAADLYAILVQIGGGKLVGQAKAFDQKTFWPSVSY
ncbi:ABC transporter substrate-binding protein [Microvirga sp. KLBC 81]|uniref:ABC transporter substrate-binding protein n=1 Tax=Microvirga sp. KLBC 81 TaxID=1862707 RepID=UPI000D51B5DC|nr:ABC transporter substrate-binding protein [Microvirga sp. KLBC 81]PVE23612.1 ABC transporter substrate-binding protein [Microvirga sp. KLBC 81]